MALKQAAQERETAEAKTKEWQAQAVLDAADRALAQDDAPSALARLEEARRAGVDAAVLGERRRRLRDRVETLTTAAASEAKQALQKNDAAAARAAIKRARDLKAQAEALEAVAIEPDTPNIALAKNELALKQASRERETAEAKRKQEHAQAALRAADAALARDDVSSVLARLDEARQLGVDAAVLGERRQRLRDRVETLATAAGLEAKQALQKNDAAAARAAIKRARDLKAQAEALDSAQP
ncbi:MAG: hypothetical protein ACRDH5_03045 [bacterium]